MCWVIQLEKQSSLGTSAVAGQRSNDSIFMRFDKIRNIKKSSLRIEPNSNQA
jgi:hypothetical protein